MTLPPEPVDPREAGEILKRARKKLGLTQGQVIEAVGIPNQSYLSALENGRYNVANSEYLSLLAQTLKLTIEEVRAINPAAVVTIASPAPKEEPPVQPADPFDYIYVEPHCLAHAGPGDSHDTVPRGNAVMVRKSDVKRRHTEYAYASGNSMTKPDGSGIHDGALLFVDVHDLELRDGDAYLIKVPGNGFYVKRARWQFGEWWLHSDNPEYPPYQEDKAMVVGYVYKAQNPAFKP